jgi:hypothetical protein
MTITTTAPVGRVYWFNAKARPATILEWARDLYATTQGVAPTYLRCHPSQEQLFAALWPGVLPDPRIQRGMIMLGVES